MTGYLIFNYGANSCTDFFGETFIGFSPQALLDIQEFYELTLMDESKSVHIKTSEALQMASR